MSHFLGTHLNKLDAKGRVSIPATFRAVLRDNEDASLVLRSSTKHPCIEAWPMPVFEALASPLDRLPTFSDDQDDLATDIYAGAASVEPDREGRVILPAELIVHAGLGETVAFMGLGRIFQIWQPEAAERRRAEARERARSQTLTLPPSGRA